VLQLSGSSTSPCTATLASSSTQPAKSAFGLSLKKASASSQDRYLGFDLYSPSASESPRRPKAPPHPATRMHQPPIASNHDRVRTSCWILSRRSEITMLTIVMATVRETSSRKRSTLSHRAVCTDRKARRLDGTTRALDMSDSAWRKARKLSLHNYPRFDLLVS
jgi:hypothetical protein